MSIQAFSLAHLFIFNFYAETKDIRVLVSTWALLVLQYLPGPFNY